MPSTSSKKTTTNQRANVDHSSASKRVNRRSRAIVTQPVNGFVVFMREKAVVGLALGVVFGTQAKTIVDSLTSSFINPLIGLLIPGSGNLTKQTFSIHHGRTVSVFAWGSFTATMISFFIVAAIVYFVVKGFRLDKLDTKT